MNPDFSMQSHTQDIPVLARCSKCGRNVRGTVKPSLEHKNAHVVSFVCCKGENMQVEDSVLWKCLRVTSMGPHVLFSAFGGDRRLQIVVDD